MSIKETIATINQMQTDAVIGPYAIGGAVAANFYPVEPVDTQDLDVFVALEPASGQSLVSLTPIYDYLQTRGCQQDAKGDIVISGWPVQFLPVGGDALLEEALKRSVEKNLDGVPVRVFTIEHLAAIAFKVGRPKDKRRLDQFLEANVLEEPIFSDILRRHDLLDRWLASRGA